MGEAFGAYGSAGHALDMVVAYGGGGLQAGGDVVGVDDVALLGAVGPDAGVAVGLEFEVDGEAVALGGILALQTAYLHLGAEDLLDVVA